MIIKIIITGILWYKSKEVYWNSKIEYLMKQFQKSLFCRRDSFHSNKNFFHLLTEFGVTFRIIQDKVRQVYN